MRDQLRWVHLSDIHAASAMHLDQRVVFEKVSQDLATRRNEGWQPDVVFVTGDIASKGLPQDYQQIQDYLIQLSESIGVPRSRFVFCPGNHDVDWNQSPYLLSGCLTDLTDLTKSQKFLHSQELPNLLRRQEEYRKLLDRFYQNGEKPAYCNKKLHTFVDLNIGEMKVAILAANSSWLCRGGEIDRGRLQVGLRHLEDVLRDWPDQETDLAIFLIHHPFDWLAPFEADHVEALVCRVFDLVLRGHNHLPKVRKLSLGVNDAVMVTAGAIYDPSLYTYEFSCGTLDVAAAECRIDSAVFLSHQQTWSTVRNAVPFIRASDRQHSLAALIETLRAFVPDLTQRMHIGAVLTGVQSDIAFSFHGVPGFHSPQLLGSEFADHCGEAIRLLRIKRLLDFYGEQKAEALCKTYADDLISYDVRLNAWTLSDDTFAAATHQRTIEAETLAMTERTQSTPSFALRFMRRCVAEGNHLDLKQFLDRASRSDGWPLADFGRTLLMSLECDENGTILYPVWKASGGDDDFTFAEFGQLILLALDQKNVKLAVEILFVCAGKYPAESAKGLVGLVRMISSEAGDPGVLQDFLSLVQGERRR